MVKTRIRVYVAGAINANNVIDTLKNIKNGIRTSAGLIKTGFFAPFCPHLDYQYSFFEDITIEEYYEYSMSWLEVSDVVVVLPNSENSMGVKEEIKRAKELGIKIIYLDEEDFDEKEIIH